jgi:para-nitrobenzyl esterase
MKWVRDNISAFGGDPNAITIMGQSAGGMSVQNHCLSPLSEGLFRGAVMSSGGGVNKILSAAPAEKMYDFWHAVMENCGAKNLEEFRNVKPSVLFESWKAMQSLLKKPMSCFPCIDGEMITGTGVEIFEAKKHHKINYLVGSTSHDMMTLFMSNMAKDWCENQEKESYTWLFDRVLPGETNGAWHSSDLWYWFDTLQNGWRPWEEQDRRVASMMSDYLVNFVKTGNPNGANLPKWESAQDSKKSLFIGEGEPKMAKPNKAKLLWTMLTTKSVGE